MANVLVIDDDLDLLNMLRLMLERGGHTVSTTADGADGLNKARELNPDIAIIDVMMPGMHGYQVCRKLREDPATAHLAILILTARAQPVDREAALAAQADDYMSKPVSPTELLTKVNELLNRKQAADEPKQFLLTLLSLRGGVGVTSIAVNLALTVQQSGAGTCLVDLAPGAGHTALQLRLTPKVSWMDWLRTPADLNAQGIDKYLLTHESGLRLLAAPFVPAPETNVPPEPFLKMLSLLREKFQRVIVDAPPVLNGAARAAVQIADEIWLVLAPEVASLQSTVATLRALKALNVDDDKIALVSNQVSARPGLTQPAIEKALNRPVAAALPYDEAQAATIGQGAPLMLGQPDSPLAAAIRAIA
ncbi:MAG TPA: response regulator [Anaerolineae bacterium]|nr:response regulator [Anaerolineae bacterium]